MGGGRVISRRCEEQRGGGELGYKGDRFVGGVARGKVRGQLLREVRIISEF